MRNSAYISTPEFKSTIVYQDGDTGDIIKSILDADLKFYKGTKKLSETLKASTIKQTAANVHKFIRENIRYEKDMPGQQLVKSPARLWFDKAGDCKSFSLFAGSIFKNLNIPYSYRFVSFSNAPTYTHVYVVVPAQPREFIVDAVLPTFDTETPYKFKSDYRMTKIVEMNGITRIPIKRNEPAIGFVFSTATVATGAVSFMKEKGLAFIKNFFGDIGGKILDFITNIIPNFKGDPNLRWDNVDFTPGAFRESPAPTPQQIQYITIGKSHNKEEFNASYMEMALGDTTDFKVGDSVYTNLKGYNTPGTIGKIWLRDSNDTKKGGVLIVDIPFKRSNSDLVASGVPTTTNSQGAVIFETGKAPSIVYAVVRINTKTKGELSEAYLKKDAQTELKKHLHTNSPKAAFKNSAFFQGLSVSDQAAIEKIMFDWCMTVYGQNWNFQITDSVNQADVVEDWFYTQGSTSWDITEYLKNFKLSSVYKDQDIDTQRIMLRELAMLLSDYGIVQKGTVFTPGTWSKNSGGNNNKKLLLGAAAIALFNS